MSKRFNGRVRLDLGDIVEAMNEALADLDTGPLSDMEYVDGTVNEEDQLELWLDGYPFPGASVDTPQLAKVILALLEERKIID